MVKLIILGANDLFTYCARVGGKVVRKIHIQAIMQQTIDVQN